LAGAYSSWQRGLNERANGLVRKFLPKGTGFRRVTDGEVKEVQERLDASAQAARLSGAG